jgi:hypothetical protein
VAEEAVIPHPREIENGEKFGDDCGHRILRTARGAIT